MANDLTWFSDTRLVRKTLFSLWEVAPACCFNKPNDQTAPGEGEGRDREQSELEMRSKVFRPQESTNLFPSS